ncbi:MAG: DKNYY domain-containing protein [Marinosulfonomonas sp.]
MKTTLAPLTLLSASLLSSCGHFGYEVKHHKVVHAIWDGSGRVERPLKGADAETFTVLKPHHYAKDKHAVYHRQSVIQGAIPSTFILLNDGYAVDSEHVFYDGALLPDRDASTFETMNVYWTRDRHEVYFLNQAIQACDPISFKVVLERWAMDAQCTYVAEARVDGADQPSFHALSDDYAKDKHQVYARVNHITLIRDPITGRSRNISETTLSRIRKVDVESFAPSDNRTCGYDARDRLRCYRRGEAVSCDCSE